MVSKAMLKFKKIIDKDDRKKTEHGHTMDCEDKMQFICI